MKSFELAIDRLQQLESGLRDRLDELESLRNQLPADRERLRLAGEELRASPLHRLVSSGGDRLQAVTPTVSLAEAWSFARRHSTQESPHEGYHQMARDIRQDYREMRLSTALLREFHRHVVGQDTAGAGQWKTSNNFFPVYDEVGSHVSSILTTSHELVPEQMESLETRFLSAWESQSVHPLLLIALFWLDLLAIHPFRDGNGRVARLAVLLLLCHSEYSVAENASLEGFVGRRRTSYVSALRASLEGWTAARHDPQLWCAFMLDFLRDAHLEFSRRTKALASTIEQSGEVAAALAGMPDGFRLTELQDRLPSVPDGILRLVLNRAREDGHLEACVTQGVVTWKQVGGESERLNGGGEEHQE